MSMVKASAGAAVLLAALAIGPGEVSAMPIHPLDIQTQPIGVQPVWCCRYGYGYGYGWRRPYAGWRRGYYGRRYYGWHGRIGERGPRIGSYAR